MTGGIDQHKFVVNGQILSEWSPALTVLGESMQQDESVSVTKGFSRKAGIVDG
jgi:hypothetical protein